MKQRIFCMLMAFVIVFTTVDVNAFAVERLERKSIGETSIVDEAGNLSGEGELLLEDVEKQIEDIGNEKADVEENNDGSKEKEEEKEETGEEEIGSEVEGEQENKEDNEKSEQTSENGEDENNIEENDDVKKEDGTEENNKIAQEDNVEGENTEDETSRENENDIEEDKEVSLSENDIDMDDSVSENDINVTMQETSMKTTVVDGEITRAEWLSKLAETFEMTVEEDCYPDNYFSDLDSTSEYYYDVLLNVEFGVIDIEEGGEVKPEEAASREFAAHTLNFCLSYQVDESMPVLCSDIDDNIYKDDILIAIDRGWLELIDGNFLPQKSITLAETERMLEDAKAILLSMEVDTNAIKNFQLASDVIVITKECEITSDLESGSDEEALFTIIVNDLKEKISKGTRFAVYENEIPIVYVAKEVSVEGNLTIITAKVDNSGTAYESATAQDIVTASILDVKPLDDAEIRFVNEETQEEFATAEAAIAAYGAKSKSLAKTTANIKKEIDFGDGLTAELELVLKNPKVTYDVNRRANSAYAYLECDTELTVHGNFDMGAFSPINSIPIVDWSVPGVGGFTIYVDLDINTSVTLSKKEHIKVGVSASESDGARLIHDFHTESFSLVAQAKADIGMTAKLGITKLPVLNAYVYASVGGIAKITQTEWLDDKLPYICLDFKAYIYAYYGYTATIKAGIYNKTYGTQYNLITEKNSPIRCLKHYEDGIEVMECSREATESGGEAKKRYITPSSSSWSGSYYGKGKGISGTDGSGNVVPTYEYSLKSDNETITVTKYNGSSTSLVIPSEIDGYKVTGIGKSVFRNNIRLRKVVLPDSITLIEDFAFAKCSNLTSINLPKKLETIGYSAFQNCDALTAVTIPKALKECTDASYVDQKGAFSNCDGLKTVLFEEGSTEVACNLFYNCTGLEEIELPNTIETIEQYAFANCTNLKKAVLPDSVTGMGTYVFAGCSNLEEVKLPKTRYYIMAGTFQGCTKLKTIKLPDTLEVIQGYAFQKSGLTELELPNTVKEIQASAFMDCASLEEITLSENLSIIRASAFRNCDSLREADIPFSVYQIGNYAFYDCEQLQKVIISDGVTSLGTYVFQSCDELSEVTLGMGLTSIPNYTFADCGKLKAIIIPYHVTSINQYAFTNCTSLTEVTIPQKTTTINSNAFSYPGKMTIYGVKGSYAETFANAEGITFVEKNVPAETVTFKSDSYSVNYNTSTKFVPTIFPADFTDTMAWKSSNTSVATVDENGVVKAVGTGTTTIKLVVGRITASFKLTVTQPVTSIYLNYYNLNMEAGESRTLTASVYPTNADNRKLQWSSSDEKIATVSEDGVVKAGSKGNCVITAAATDGSNVKATCTITVLNEMYVANTMEELQSPHPYENGCKDIWQYKVNGAQKLEVTFDEATYVEDGFDYIYIKDGNNNEVGSYTGNELSNKTITIDGDTVYIQLVADNVSNEYGFKVAGVKAITKPITYTIIYDKNSLTAIGTMDRQTVVSNSGATLLLNQYQNIGYMFVGWNTKADGTGVMYADGAEAFISEANNGDIITLYAQWEEVELEKLDAPYADIENGSTVNKGTLVSLKTSIAGAKIYYTLDGSVPTTGSILYEEPIAIWEDTIITAIASKAGYIDSNPVIFKYIVSKTGDVLPEDIPADGIEAIPEGLWIAGIDEGGYTYTGKAIKPEIRVYDSTTLLKEKTDYTISYKNNTNANDGLNVKKAPTITVTGKGNYTGKDTAIFVINAKDIDGSDITSPDILKKYNGKIQKVVPTVKDNGKALKNKTHYTVEYPEVSEANPDAYKTAGTYKILIQGKGNYTGTKEIFLTISEFKLISQASVSSIRNQTYSGKEITPSIVVKEKKKILTEGIDYQVFYENNVEIGTATVIISGLGDYVGEKRINFKIIGTALSKATVTGIPKTIVYTGQEIEVGTAGWETSPLLTVTVNKQKITLVEGKDYTVSYLNNTAKGNGTIVFTGINGYTGTLKKKFAISSYNINTDAKDRITAYLIEDAFYQKGGSKPKPVVMFGDEILQEGKDYTLSYKNHTAVNNKSNPKKIPTITIKGKGNFTGNYNLTFTILPKDISELKMSVADKVYQNKKNSYKTTLKVTDITGKSLSSGTDYEKTINYSYKSETVLKDGTVRRAGEAIGANDIPPVDTVIVVTVCGKGNYTGVLTGEYRLMKKDIGKAKVTIPKQTYTGKPVTLDRNEIKVTHGKVTLGENDYKIVGYTNNIKKGTAKVTIKGTGEYGGTKTVSFTIKAKGFLWWKE